MRRLSWFLWLVTISLTATTPAFADATAALVLSPAEMQKLTQYFPAAPPTTTPATARQSLPAEATHLVWHGDPLTVELPLNQEKRLIFPTKVVADLKGALTTAQLRLLNDDKSLYLTALQPFPPTRLFVTLENTHAVLLIDLVTSAQASRATTTITLKPTPSPVSNSPITRSRETETAPDESAVSATDNDTYVTLTRFAWQQLYAPLRLLSNPLGITRAPMHTVPLVTTLVYGDKVYAHPLATWHYQDTYLTAVILRNKYPHAATIDLEHDVCGAWQAAALYPRRQLKPAGDKTGDSTVLLLISSQPFGASLGVCDGRA